MSTDIYYFSGTGNSLAVARDLATNTHGTLISIPAVIEKSRIHTDADTIGIVFPSYHAQLFGIPLIVERFINKLDDLGSKYICAVCTCGGHEHFNGLPTLKHLGKIIQARGGTLSAEFSIQLPMNSLDYSHVPFIDKNQDTMFKNCQQKIEGICHCITHRKTSTYTLIPSLLNVCMTPMYLMLQKLVLTALKKYAKVPHDTHLTSSELMLLTDNSIYADDTCNGCATCAQVCPAHNIHMLDEKPVWQHRCEMCLACVEWCPIQAIHHWCRVEGKTYHHPTVTLSDMLRSVSNG